MTSIRRALAVSGFLAVVAALTWGQVWGDSQRKNRTRRVDVESGISSATADEGAGSDYAATKFAQGGLLTYRTRDGEVLFALQVKPRLTAPAPRPCDYLLLVDTSASQVGEPLLSARKLVEEIAATAGKDDRISLWTVNIPEATKDLTHGFRAPQSAAVRDALARLKAEVPLGDTDLNQGIARAAASFEIEPTRQRAIVFLGDGMSLHNPITAGDRSRLCDDMVRNEIAFFPIPVGPKLEPQNLHGFASGTGGRVVRLAARDRVAETVGELRKAVAAPVLYPTRLAFEGDAVVESVPTRLPPLRPDVPTLVIGKLKPAATLAYALEGSIAGTRVRVEAAEAVKEPEIDNFFLVGMFQQWRNAKDQPALMQADRALAFAQEANQMARAELLAEAEQALAKDRLDAAARLFKQVTDLDPNDVEARGGLQVVEKIRSGKLTKDELRRQLNRPAGEALVIEKRKETGQSEIRRDRLEHLLAQAAQPPAREAVPPPAPAGAANPAGDLLRQQRQRQAIEEQRVTQSVEESLREARRVLPSNPQDARDLLKRSLAAVRDNLDIGDAVRTALVGRLEGALRNAEIEGARIVRDQAERLRLLAVAQERVAQRAAATAYEERIQGRMRVFHTLMNQARFEDAYKQALAITQDAINEGAPIPVAVTAAYDIGLVATNLKEVQELRRVREQRYLLTMLQVEKSHVPFPDEPPVQFPPAATWRELTRLRKERYESTGLSEEDPATLRRVRELRDATARPVTFEFESGPLKDALGFLNERYNVPIIVDTEAFKEIGVNDVENSPVKLSKVSGVSLGTVLRLLLAQVQGTYIIRREFIEVTTGQRQAAEKTIRVYPVADLVIPIPNSINQAAVNQAINNSILGFQLDLARASFGAVLGGLGALGVTGIGLAGNIGAVGALGALGALGGAGLLGGVGGGLAGNIGGVGGVGGGGPTNLGVGGGGVAGFAGFGGQLGQLGNLGGQFGLQGGDQSQILIRLITQVVGTPQDWAPPGIFDRPRTGPQNGVGSEQEDVPAGDPNQAGALGYFPPARALVVKGTSRIHTRLGGGLLGPRPGAPPGADNRQGALDRIKKDFLAKGGANGDPFEKLKDAVQKGKEKPSAPDAGGALAARPAAPKSDLDPRKIWQDALAQGVKDPGLIIAVADYLVEHGKFDHAAEFLKADLRLGIVARPWVYEALAIALKESKGSLEDIERAELSAVDLEPQDAQGFLRASRAMGEFKRYDRALAFCRQASLLQPDAPQPYADALLYAELGKDSDAMQWAAGNLLGRDWPTESDDLHARAREKLKALIDVLRSERRDAEAGRMSAAAELDRQRDLVVKLTWQSEADLDLEVREPIGTVCSFQKRMTSGGGTLIGDTLEDRNSETYVAAQGFPGDYQITVRRVWGRPLGSKATVEIIQHQGTPEETHQRETVVFDRSHTMTFHLATGRRTSLAQVPPAPLRKPLGKTVKSEGGDYVLNKLRSLADPEIVAEDSSTRGGVGSAGLPVDLQGLPPTLPAGGETDPVSVQTRVSPLVGNSVDLTARASISPDRRFVRFSLDPVFETMAKVQSAPVVSNPLIPGGAP